MITYEKWLKIEAMMLNKASTPNEKAICKKILADNPKPPKPAPARPNIKFYAGMPRTQESGDFWREAQRRSEKNNERHRRRERRQDAARNQRQAFNMADSARRQREAAQGSADPGTRRQDRWDQYIELLKVDPGARSPGQNFMDEIARITRDLHRKGNK